MSYSSEVLADSPLVYWKLAEASGTTMVDSSGNARDGAYTGSPTLGQTGPFTNSSDTAALFNGTTQYGSLAFASWMNGLTALTIEVWVKTTATSGTAFGRSSTSANYRVGVSSGKAFVEVRTSSGNYLITSATSVNDGNWHYVCGRWTGSSLVVEVDGVQEDTTTTTGGLITGNNALRIAQRNSDSFLAGTIAQAALYSTNIGPTRMAAHYAAGKALIVSGGLPVETDTALAGSVSNGIRVNGGLPTETDVALAGSVAAGARLAGGLTTETDTALAGSVVSGQVINLGFAAESDTALSGTLRVGIVLTGGLATQADTALSVTLSVVSLGLATETNTALAGAFVTTPSYSLGLAVETDVALAGYVDEGYTRTVFDRRGGRTRAGLGVASWEPAVAAVPDGLTVGVTIDTAFAFTSATVGDNAQVVLTDVIKASTLRDRYRITVGGHDITFFRGINTPELDYDLIQPLMYGVGTLRLPQVKLVFETPGEGALSWLKVDATVKQQRIAADGTKTTDYIGFISAFDNSGEYPIAQLGGIASGTAAEMEHPLPLFKKKNDLGRRAWKAMHDIGLNLRPFLGPTTGIDIQAFGGSSQLDYINQLCALGVTKGGDQWTIMPNTNGTWHLSLKDTDTIHGTVYADDDYVKANLRRDTAEEPNRIFGTGVTPDGMRVLGGVYEGLKQGSRRAPYPMADGSNFGVGTTDADTDTGDGVSVMIHKLQVAGYLNRRDSPGGYDDDVAEAIEGIQDDAELPSTGTMTKKTWAALHDLDVTGASLSWSHIEPMAQATETKFWRRTGSGAIIGRNPGYDRRVRKRDRTVDFGTGFERSQMHRYARAEKVAASTPNWVGDLTFETGALVAGMHTPGDPLTEADVMCALDLRPGMNLWLPHFDGGTKVHVSACSVSGGKVTASVDTRARDSMQVWQVIQRNRETRRSPRRAFIRDHSSGMMRDAIGEWSEVGGMLGNEVEVRGGRWTVFEVITGQAGTIGKIDVRTSPDAEFVMAVFAKKMPASRLNALVPNPLADKSKWTHEATRNKLDDKLLLYAAGDPTQPLGYHPSSKTDSGSLTGEWKDEAGFGYQTFEKPVLYVAIFADRDTVIPAGRIMWPQQEPL